MAKKSIYPLTFDSTTQIMLHDIATHENKSMTVLVNELILEALKQREDKFLSAIAETREKENTENNLIQHEAAWN